MLAEVHNERVVLQHLQPFSASEQGVMNSRWAPGIIFNLVALDRPKVKCNTPGRTILVANLHFGSRAHPDTVGTDAYRNACRYAHSQGILLIVGAFAARC